MKMESLMAGLLGSLKRWMGYEAQRSFYVRHCPEVANKSLFIRPMKKGDLKAVAAIEESAYNFPWSLGVFKNCLKVGYSCWIGEIGEEVVAYGILALAAGEAHVMNICVSPRYRGKSYGRMMLENLMEVARLHRADMILLEVRPTNEVAIHLYHKMGFNEIGRRKDYYPAVGGNREDALVMARMLE